MAREKLKDLQVKNLKPRPSQYKVSDGGGLYVLVTVTGSKLWQMAYRYGGKQKTFSIGPYPVVSLAMARDKYVEVKRQLLAGIDPGEAKKAAREERDGRKTFKDAADGWANLLEKKPRAEKTRDRDQRMSDYLVKAFGDKPLEEVKSPHLVALLDVFEEAGSYETRMRLQSTAINIAGFAQGKAWIETNPFLGISFGKAFTASKNTKRPAIVDAEPFGQLLRNIATYPGRYGNLVGKALELLALTFVRPGTVVGAEWSEFDLDAALWTIPFAKLKQRSFREGIEELKGKPHFVPLARQTVALLRNLHKQTGNSRYVFPGRPKRSISTNGLEVALNSLGYQNTHCPHGFRSSASTMLNAERVTVDGVELPRFAEQAIEFQLEHVDASQAAIYNRNQRLPERTKMMQHWADMMDTMRNSTTTRDDRNVVPFDRKQA